jgi:hypothetical protein
MGSHMDELVLKNIQELRRILRSSNGKLVKSKISPKDYFTNLSHDAPVIKYPEVGISRIIVNICELISMLLLEDTDESNSTSKVIVMIFEYYFLVGPILFKSQGARFVNDVTFMKQFAQYIKSLCKTRAQAQKELGNILVSLDLYNPIKDIDT